MRIAVRLPNIDPTAGGAHTFQNAVIQGLLECLPTARHEFVLYSDAPFSDEVTRELAKHGPRVRALWNRNSLDARVARKLVRLLNKFQHFVFDKRVIRLKTWFEKSLDANGIHAVWFATPDYLECNRPYVFTIWDLAHLEQPWWPEVSVHGEWERREAMLREAIGKATRIIVPNPAGMDELLRSYTVSKDRVLLLTHPTPSFPAPDSRRDLKETLKRHGIQRPFVLYPAQFWAHKNHVNLVNALKVLRDTGGPDLEVVFVGSEKGNLAHVKAHAEKLGLADRVRFLGFVSTSDLVDLYRSARALAYVSFCGPENMPPLEAFALGCPVIASRIAGSAEQLGDAVRSVDPGDPRDIARAIQDVCSDEALRSALRAKGLARAAAWTGKDYAAGVLTFFDSFEKVRECWL